MGAIIILKFFKKPMPYIVGGLILGILNIILLAFSGMSWQITSGFLLWGVKFLRLFNIDALNWEYFFHFKSYYEPIIESKSLVFNRYTILNIGVLLGSLIATLLACEFKLKRIKNKKQLLMALVGGILMGYGTRLAVGCNIGAFFSGIPSFSLHAWVFGIFTFLGVYIGLKILIKYLI